MKKIIFLVLIMFCLSGCKRVPTDSLDDENFCHSCHGWNCKDEEYGKGSRDMKCIKCHPIDVCERGNDWKTRELEKRKAKPKSRKSKKRRR